MIVTDYALIPRDEQVRDEIGHWYRVLSGGPYQYLVQAQLRDIQGKLCDVYAPVRMYRSDMRRDGE